MKIFILRFRSRLIAIRNDVSIIWRSSLLERISSTEKRHPSFEPILFLSLPTWRWICLTHVSCFPCLLFSARIFTQQLPLSLVHCKWIVHRRELIVLTLLKDSSNYLENKQIFSLVNPFFSFDATPPSSQRIETDRDRDLKQQNGSVPIASASLIVAIIIISRERQTNIGKIDRAREDSQGESLQISSRLMELITGHRHRLSDEHCSCCSSHRHRSNPKWYRAENINWTTSVLLLRSVLRAEGDRKFEQRNNFRAYLWRLSFLLKDLSSHQGSEEFEDFLLLFLFCISISPAWKKRRKAERSRTIVGQGSTDIEDETTATHINCRLEQTRGRSDPLESGQQSGEKSKGSVYQ